MNIWNNKVQNTIKYLTKGLGIFFFYIFNAKFLHFISLNINNSKQACHEYKTHLQTGSCHAVLTRQVKPSQHVRMEKGLQIVLGQRCNEEFQIISFRPLCFDSSRPTCIYMSFECYFTHVVLFLTQPFGAKRYMTAHLLCSFILSAARILRVREWSAVWRATEDSGFNNLSIYRV